MKKFIFAMMFCFAAVCGVQAQENPMKFNGLVVEYAGDNAQAKEAATALQAVMPEVAKVFGMVVDRDYVSIDYSGGVTFVSGENGEKKTTGQIFGFDQGDAISLAVSMDFKGKGYDLNVAIKANEDMKGATLVFDNQEVVAAVSGAMPNAADHEALVKVYNTISQYPDIKLGMSVKVDLASMM